MWKWWNNPDRIKRRTERKYCPSSTLSAINPIWTALGSNPGLLLLSHSTCDNTEEEEGDEKEAKGEEE